MDFVAIDFETANEDLASICQVGIVRFKAGTVAETFTTLINPEDDFSSMNIFIHGIREHDVKDAPVFSEIYEKIFQLLSNTIVVSHTAFDRTVLKRAIERYNLPFAEFNWLDSARVARRAWEKYARSGYGLSSVAKDLGIDFKHHDALEDARAAGLILIKACEATGKNLADWQERVEKPIGGETGRITREGNIEGILYGEVAVFTGALDMPRQNAADLAAAAGCDVASSVTKKTTLLIVGDQDIRKLKPGTEKSTKHQKAESLISQGVPIRILQESDFLKVVNFKQKS